MNALKQPIVFLIAVVLAASCKPTSDVVGNGLVQKRKYRKGYHIHAGGRSSPVVSATTQESCFFYERQLLPQRDGVEPSFISSTYTCRVDCGMNEACDAPIDHEAATQKVVTRFNNAHVIHEHPGIERHSPTGYEFQPEEQDLARAEPEEERDQLDLLVHLIVSVVLPPIAIYLLYGIGSEFWIGIFLTLLLWLPGVIYASVHVFRQKG